MSYAKAIEVLTPISTQIMILFQKETGNTFGKFINHSSIHANIGTKIFVIDEGELDVLFYSLRKIKVGEQLLWDYSKNFYGVSNCVKDCF